MGSAADADYRAGCLNLFSKPFASSAESEAWGINRGSQYITPSLFTKTTFFITRTCSQRKYDSLHFMSPLIFNPNLPGGFL